MGGKLSLRENSNGGVNGMIGIDTKFVEVAGADGVGFGFEEMKPHYKLEDKKSYGTVGNIKGMLLKVFAFLLIIGCHSVNGLANVKDSGLGDVSKLH